MNAGKILGLILIFSAFAAGLVIGKNKSSAVAPIITAGSGGAAYESGFSAKDDELKLRSFPEAHDGRDNMHNDCMKSAKLTLQTVSRARVKWMSSAPVKRGRTESGEPAPGGAPPAQRRR